MLDLTLLPAAAELLHAHGGQARVWLRQADLLPMRVTFQDGKGADVQVDVVDPKVSDPWPAERWRLTPGEQDKLHTVALSHLTKFIEVAPKILRNQIPTLGPATGQRELVATSGKGRLEMIDGTRVLFLMGTPEEMGRQHGKLLNAPIHDVANRILYGIGVGSSFAKGNWFIDEIESAEARLEPHMDPRYLREMDAIAKATGMHPQEARLANFFPELFHCSGFALMNGATRDGHVYHGRVLDYMRGVGLEQNAVVIIHQPDVGHAWVNISYAGFVGSVTAMNEKGISVGEMGGRGYGAWDGKPMAQLIREVMEKASTLDEAVEIMRRGPRTCEYYYVIADGNAKTAVGIGATPDKFEVVRPGEAHARLPHPVQDTVLVSAGDRYDLLAERVKAGWGKFDADSARDLMTRPVCMTSNIHSVLFRPDTLDLWVANADSKNVASATRYTHYNLKDLMRTRAPDPGF
ncbi:MAG TPA: C45 family peptidase [Gemmataceae bacterium]|nr:C45 family peptidase [Gemmataceae bacterium]